MAKLTLDTYRRDYPDIREDFTVPQRWRDYSAEEHAVWNTLGARQGLLLPGLACEEFMQGLATLGLRSSGIPDFEKLSATLQQATGWQVVAVPGLVPDEVFFEHLANRRFPAGRFIRSREQLDYLQEPDIFQQTYFVIESFEQLLRETAERDFAPVYEQLRKLPDLAPDAIDASDEVLQRGTQRYARARAKDRA